MCKLPGHTPAPLFRGELKVAAEGQPNLMLRNLHKFLNSTIHWLIREGGKP